MEVEFVTTSRYICIYTVLIATDKWFFCFIPRVLQLKCQCGDHVSWSRSSVIFLSASSMHQGSHLMWAGTTAFHILFGSVFNRSPSIALCSTMVHGLLIIEVSKSHTAAHHRWLGTSGWVISLSQESLPDNTQHSQETDIHAPWWNSNPNPSSWVAADPSLRPCSHWDQLQHYINLQAEIVVKWTNNKQGILFLH